MSKLLFFCLLFALLSRTYSQNSPYVAGQILVMLENEAPRKVLARPLTTSSGAYQYPILNKSLSQSLRIFLLETDTSSLSTLEALRQIQSWEGVRFAQLNHRLEHRSIMATSPDDPNFTSQWSLDNQGQNGGLADADIDAPEAWDITTGGLTVQGDTLVVAVIDLGMDLQHEDLVFWKNHREIPDNGIDDDGNGYIDDYHGWNANENSDQIPLDVHGTPVAGVIAARGNNAKGISGVSWQTQIMPLVNLLAVESEVIEAYGYVLEMRKRYNRSAGAEGAFVVASNSSFGVDLGNPANFPLWCSIYDSLGAQGILNVAATTNASRNVDIQHDIPSGCQSDFLITVTNTTRLDSLNTGAGYGVANVDLGAPGTQISSTRENNTYGTYSGTSFATPHVSGVLALLYAAACPEIISQYKLTPGAMALEFKNWILAGVDPLNGLNGKTQSGGRLNAYNSLILQQNDCSNYNLTCLSPYKLQARNVRDTSALLSWSAIGEPQAYTLRYKAIEAQSWISYALSDTFYSAGGLQSCTDYVFQVSSNCSSDSSGFLASGKFTTEGCCEAPSSFRVISIDSSQVLLAWKPVFGAQTYLLEYKEADEENWKILTTSDTLLVVDKLSSCQDFLARLSTDCGNLPLQRTDTLGFKTQACGFCLDTEYCESRAKLSQFEWIEEVRIGPIQNASGANGGYSIFADPAFVLTPDSAYQITLIHNYIGLPGKQYWKIWIDANQDGVFAADGTELFFDSEVPIEGEFSDTLFIPATMPLGPSRLRVSMKFEGTLNPLDPPQACEVFTYGEVEDYCIQVKKRQIVGLEENFEKDLVRVFPNPVRESVRIEATGNILGWQLFDTAGRLLNRGEQLKEKNFQIDMSQLPVGIYYLSIQMKNGNNFKKILRI